MDITVADGNVDGISTLLISGVETGLAVLQNNVYILSVRRYADDLKVELWNSTTSALATFDSSSAPTFVDSQAIDSCIVLKAGNIFGSVGFVLDNDKVGSLVQILRCQVDGAPLGSGNLGTYTDGVFQNLGATYSVGQFTLNGNNYTRVALSMSPALQNALGFDSSEITGDLLATRQIYKDRVQSVEIICKSIYLNKSVASTNFDEIQEPTYHIVNAKKLRFEYKFYDAANRTYSKKHIANHWGLSLSLR